MEKSGIKSEFKENLKNMQIFSEASAVDTIIKICPRLAGVGPQRDYSITDFRVKDSPLPQQTVVYTI